MPTARRSHVAIVGGGFSGAAVAFHLLAPGRAEVDVTVVEPAAELGQGLAYSTPCDSHCLNVPAGRLGIDPAHEDGFVDWLRAQQLPFTAASFVPRRWLGRYVAHALARQAAQPGAALAHARARVDAVARHDGGFALRLSDGATLHADQVVLATGHLPPARPGAVDWTLQGMAADPWQHDTTSALQASAEVLLIGSGLTAVDAVMKLDDAGHRGRIHLLSRHGLLPQPHRDNDNRPGPTAPVDLSTATGLRDMLARFRRSVARDAAVSGDWRDAMASLRDATPQLWQRLSDADRRRFLRHLQAFWDIHRHRFAPDVARRLQALRAAGRVTLQAGRLVGVAPADDGALRASWRARGGASTASLRVARVINCTGPTSDLSRARDPLHASLRDAGIASADALGLGLRVDEKLRVLDADGRAVDGLHYVGPMLKAQRWEAVAVPELRLHARAIATHIVQALRPL